MSIYDSEIQEDCQRDYNRKLKGEYYTVATEAESKKKDPPAVLNCIMQDAEYEFTGVEPSRKLVYKYHPIKEKELYMQIYSSLSDLINKYPNLFTIKLDKKDKQDVYGFGVYSISTDLYYKWFQYKDQKINVYEFDISNQIFSNNMNLPFIPDDKYQYCFMSNIYIDKFGELYITVTRKNNGVSIFNTLNIVYDLYNVRDIDKSYWLEPVYKCIVCLKTYLENIGYTES